MALFIVRHQHEPERCPASDPYAGAALLNHLSRPSARRSGVEIRAEAIVEGEHSLYMIVESESHERVRDYMDLFRVAGEVDIHPASTCARAVAAGGCAEPSVGQEAGPAYDPEEAVQRAIEAGLVVHRAHPLNAETSIPALIGGVVMPNAHFYVRNHFPIPRLDPETWRLDVGGLVERPLSLTMRDIGRMPSHTMAVTIECAGNGRSRFQPPIEGERWDLGAVSTAEWTGVPLVEVLDCAGIRPGAQQLVFRGADGGEVAGRPGPVRYERSLSLDDARGSQAVLAYAMNGEALPIQHGYPLRLVVPGWYGMASVKWLTEIELVAGEFDGHFQTGAYFYEWERDGGVVREPVTWQQVRSLITEPRADAELEHGELAIRGVAWSGAAPIARVEVSVGTGPWLEAHLVGERKRHSWQWWEVVTRVDAPGEVTVRARATDLAGRTQPETPAWNRLGYGNNAIQETRIRVV
jgi:DMSO/TMAO reductase YedYZ molybdopterin-dependent catalytic subunit